MKASSSLVIALCGISAAVEPVAEIFFIPVHETSSTAASLSPALTRLVLLHRLASPGQGLSFEDIPDNLGLEDLASALNRFGKIPPPLFGNGDSSEPSQLIMLLERMTSQQMQDLRRALGSEPAVKISNQPSVGAYNEFVMVDLPKTGAMDVGGCELRQIANPLEGCWQGRQSAFAKIDVQKDSDVLSKIKRRLVHFSHLAKIEELETTLVLLPSTASSESWYGKPQELRRRQAEQVMTSLDKAAGPPGPISFENERPFILASAGKIKSCFESEDSCVEATKNCSGHGLCLNKYPKEYKPDGSQTCYECHCLSTRSDSGSLTHWAGSVCAKKDVSVAFWLFAGLTFALISILSLSISMLFNVGQEKLPGVIGAGVSRSK